MLVFVCFCHAQSQRNLIWIETAERTTEKSSSSSNHTDFTAQKIAGAFPMKMLNIERIFFCWEQYNTHTHAHRIYGQYIHADRVDSSKWMLPKETNRTIPAKICWFSFVFTVVVVLVLWCDLTNSFSWLVHSATIVNNVFLQLRWMKFSWLTVLFAVFFVRTLTRWKEILHLYNVFFFVIFKNNSGAENWFV